jgi:hypothetical protein
MQRVGLTPVVRRVNTYNKENPRGKKCEPSVIGRTIKNNLSKKKKKNMRKFDSEKLLRELRGKSR